MNMVMFSLLLKCISLRVIYLHGISLAFEKNKKDLEYYSVLIPSMGFVLNLNLIKWINVDTWHLTGWVCFPCGYFQWLQVS